MWTFVKNKWKILTSFATGMIAIITLLTLLEVEVPRPAWASELNDLKEYTIEIDSIITAQQLDHSRLSLYENLREQSRYSAENKTVPNFLIEERVLLEREIEDLQQRLRNIRNR